MRTRDGREYSPAKVRRSKAYAVTSNIDGSDRGGSSTVASEQLHSDGGIDQVAIERRSGNRHCLVVAEHFWTFSLPVADARWDVKSPELTVIQIAAARQSGATRRSNYRARREERRRADSYEWRHD